MTSMTCKAESAKWFHRDYESKFGFLKPDQLPPIDWSLKEHVQLLFPTWKREQLAAEGKAAAKGKVIHIEDLTLWTPTKDRMLFKDTELIIEPNKRCAVYGENGTGKTMLFHNIVTGQIAGFPTNISVHHMEEMSMDPEADKLSVMETVLSASPMQRMLLVMIEVLKKLVEEKADAAKQAGYESNLNWVEFMFTAINGDTAVERVERMLKVLGFDEKGFVSLMSSLSGGLRMRVALASAFFMAPELLLLDEPTNHLDLPSVLWLENQLRGYKGSYLLVTHDRNLLENVVTSVFRLQDQKIVPFAMGFAQFEKEIIKLDKKREKDIENFLKKNRNIDPMSAMYRTKMNYTEWQDKRYRREVALQGKFTFKAPKVLPNPTGGPVEDISLVEINDVRFSYDVAKGLPFIFDTPISYKITMGTRLGVMGPNGAGKSTLLKLITKQIFPVEGTINVNPDFVLAYFGQHSTKELKMDESAVEFMARSFPKAKVTDLKSHLEKTSVDSSIMEKRMIGLSYSQRSCVIFAKLTFVPPHLLIMDEPTNFLDLDSVDSLIRAANKFADAGGALITVTHNRDFLKRCSKKFLSITPGAFSEYGSMKEAERATYSFIQAMEEGKSVDSKSAIAENRGGGAVHTEEYLATKEAQRVKLAASQTAEQAAAAAAKQAVEDAAAAHAEKLAKKKAAIKTDWVAGDEGYACVANQWLKCKVIRFIPSIGVTIEKPDGKTMLIDAKKFKQENPGAGGGGGGGGSNTSKGGRGGNTNKGARGGGKGGGKGGKGAQAGRGGGKGAQAGRGGGKGSGRGGGRR